MDDKEKEIYGSQSLWSNRISKKLSENNASESEFVLKTMTDKY